MPQDLAGKRDRLLTSMDRLLVEHTVRTLPCISRPEILPANQKSSPQTIVLEIHLGTWLEYQTSFPFFGIRCHFGQLFEGLEGWPVSTL